MFTAGGGFALFLVVLLYILGVAIAATILYFVIRFAVGAAVRDNAEAIARAATVGIRRSEEPGEPSS